MTAGSTLLVEAPPLVADVTARDDSRSQPVADQQHTLTLSVSVTAYQLSSENMGDNSIGYKCV